MSHIKINSFSEYETLRQEAFEAKNKFGFKKGGIASFICSGEILPKILMEKLFEAFPDIILQLTDVADEDNGNKFALENAQNNFKNNFLTLYVTVFAYNVGRITYQNPHDEMWVNKFFCGSGQEEMMSEFIKELKAL